LAHLAYHVHKSGCKTSIIIICYLITGAATNFGLKEKLQHEWSGEIGDITGNDLSTTYQKSYSAFPYGAMARTRYGTPKRESTTLHKVNHINKNLNLRGTSALQGPEIIPSVENPPAVPAVGAVEVTT